MTGAARARGISQPAASARIREFEARWRLGVIRRSARGSSLTTDGEAVIAWSRPVLHAAETMRAALTALSQERRSGFVVAASLTVAEQLVPRWLGEFHAIRPEVRPVLRVVNSDAVAEAVRQGTANIGFVETTRVPHDVARMTVGRDRLCVVVAPTHPWARRQSPLTLEELRAASWVLREEGSGTRSTFEGALRARPTVALEVELHGGHSGRSHRGIRAGRGLRAGHPRRARHPHAGRGAHRARPASAADRHLAPGRAARGAGPGAAERRHPGRTTPGELMVV